MDIVVVLCLGRLLLLETLGEDYDAVWLGVKYVLEALLLLLGLLLGEEVRDLGVILIVHGVDDDQKVDDKVANRCLNHSCRVLEPDQVVSLI